MRRSNPRREVADRAGRHQEPQRLGDAPATWHFIVTVISMEGEAEAGTLAPLPDRRCAGAGGTSGPGTTALGSREAIVTLTTDTGTQFTSSPLLETLARFGITHRRTAYHHPEGNSYIERFHRSLKEEEVRTSEYRSLEEARASITRWIEDYNHDRPHRGVQNRTPHEAFLAFAVDLKTEALTV